MYFFQKKEAVFFFEKNCFSKIFKIKVVSINNMAVARWQRVKTGMKIALGLAPLPAPAPTPKMKWPASITIVRHGQSLQNYCVAALNDSNDSTVGTPLARIRDYDMPLTNQVLLLLPSTPSAPSAPTPSAQSALPFAQSALPPRPRAVCPI